MAQKLKWLFYYFIKVYTNVQKAQYTTLITAYSIMIIVVQRTY